MTGEFATRMVDMKEKLIELNTDGFQNVTAGNGLLENRAAVVEYLQQSAVAEVSIIIQGYGRVEKTRRCVESVLKYTTGIDYELILIDNGSTDDTLEYFHSVVWEKKTIVHVTQNIGSGYPSLMLGVKDFGKFICILGNDVIVTQDWLKNLLSCANSDLRIGMVVPVSSNVSNLQEVALPYKDYDEMQAAAAQFNKSDPRKWEDRLRLMTVAALYRKEVLLALGWPMGDHGFAHDFGDDDISFAVRRMGYRAVLAGDTWVCHGHDIRHGEGRTPEDYKRSLQIGKAIFQEKYQGVDAWDDVNQYYIPYLDELPCKKISGTAHILGVDTRCGTPILDVKNWLRRGSVFDTELSAFTQDPKYWQDLKTICQGPVICDREEFLTDSFPKEYFDFVVADRPLNCYHEPQKMINDLFSLCKKGGVVLCRLKNTFSFLEYLNLLGQREVYSEEFSYNFPLEAVCAALGRKGTVEKIIGVPFVMPEEQEKLLESLIPADLPDEQREKAMARMLYKEFLLIVEK